MSTSTKPIPIWLATHPRSCSTAFERVCHFHGRWRDRNADSATLQVFMTCREALQCLHEPFGNAFYYGPERLSPRFENDEQTRLDSGFSDTTYQKVFDRIDDEGKEVRLLPTASLLHGSFTLAPHMFHISVNFPYLIPASYEHTPALAAGTQLSFLS